MPETGHVEADLEHRPLEPLAVLGRGDGLGIGPDHLRRAWHPDRDPARYRSIARFSPVWPPSVGSTASGCSRSMIRGQHFRRQRLDVGAIGEVRVGHDRRRVRVGEDDAIALVAQHPAGLRAGVVELAGLADDDRPGADDEDRGEVVAARHQATPTAEVRRRAARLRSSVELADPAAAHRLDEPVEQVPAVVRARPRLRVVLHREGAGFGNGQPFTHAVVEVDVGQLDPARERGCVHGEVVVLAGDLDGAGREVLDRVVGAVVPERQLHRLGAQRRGRAAGGRGRCRRSAPRRAARGSPRRRTAPRSGRPARWTGRRHPARGPARRPPVVDAGTTSTRPKPARWRRIVRLIPKS